MMRITLDEIARMAGVSKATVSRVINEVPEGVSEETRRRVKDILVQINYDTGLPLASRVGVRSQSIGLILPDITNPFYAELAREISFEAMKRGYAVLLGNTSFSVSDECKFITAFVAKKVDGVILVSAGGVCTEAHQMLEKYHVPCLLLDRDVTNMERCAIVKSDNMRASYVCCELLINNGSFDIAYITGSASVSTSKERYEGYRAAMRGFNFPYSEDLIKEGNYTLESGYSAVLELERAGTKYSAILCANDLMALGALKALKELSHRVPEDVEVIGFDNIVYGQYTDPPLTTVQQPTIEMGRCAANTIIDIIEGKKIVKKQIQLQPKLLRRKTTR